MSCHPAKRGQPAATRMGLPNCVAACRAWPALWRLEATGGYELIVAASLSSAGLPLVVVNPAQVRAYAKALGQRAKTDPIDAQVIARFAEAIKPVVRPMPDQATRMLADMLARRRQIVDMIVSETLRLQRSELPRVRKSIERILVALRRELGDVDHDIDSTMRGSPIWREKEDLLASVPGVGRIVARTMVAELPELGTLGRRRWAPWLASRPSRVNPASGLARRALAAAARPFGRLSSLPLRSQSDAIRSSRPSSSACLARGKSKMAATIAVAHKLLTILNAILKTSSHGKSLDP